MSALDANVDVPMTAEGDFASTIQTGEFLVNLDTRVVSVDGKKVHLTGKEYRILELLSLRKGSTVTKEMFTTLRRCGAAAMCWATRQQYRARPM
jgi:DNA-binding response OmpR family regulator